MIKSPLRYPGGKSRGVKFLAEFIPPYKSFREVFFGGGSLSFYCIQQYKDAQYSASDLNYELYCFWSQLKDKGVELINEIQKIYNQYKTDSNGKLLFNMLVERRNNNLTELQRATDFFVLNRITFSGVVDSGGYSQGSFEGRFTQSSIDRLKQTIPIIQPIQFYCEDFSYLVKRPGDEVFIFLDPPYYTATKSKLYGKKGILHTSFDHQLLFETLQNSPHQWLITYDNSEYIKSLYKDFYQWEWQLQYGMTTRTNAAFPLGNELLIANYDLAKVREANTKNLKVQLIG
ncbi:DNA adenine methylase [Ilyomonas limi]|uniref:site-specific DNA-methyltransferase (adenine-specific) n=1 Tax=Ilyomonas limi TaxID=2575867 RepID=A0A4U3LC15_9BACT|nr:DNA adenine methylase [Ilyomonas limi]TKK71606.1 DNA adenine methylase [Ilyomonas limi]